MSAGHMPVTPKAHDGSLTPISPQSIPSIRLHDTLGRVIDITTDDNGVYTGNLLVDFEGLPQAHSARINTLRMSPQQIRIMQASRWAATLNGGTDTASDLQTALPPQETMSQIQEMPAVHDTHTSTTDTDTGQFAQTRQPDDLFDDDFTPVSETVSQFTPPHGPRIREPHGRTRNERPSRGRGRGHADRPLDSLQQGLEHQPHPTASTENNTTTDAEPAKPPTIGAVRGNRLQTGGVQKPKLTEDELSARLEAAKINNARREEAHRLAEADEASFQHREAQAREKRREEGVARKVMEGEREKNRLRKLGARGGREWDEGKKEEDFSRGRGGGYRRGMHGSVGYDQARNTGFIYEGAEEQSPLESGGRGTAEPHRGGPGRRGRGQGRGGRGRGRGGYDGGRGGQAQPIAPQTAPAVNAEEEFPSLSSANVAKTAQAGPSQETMSASQATEILKSPTGEKASWADQVDAIDAQTPAGGW